MPQDILGQDESSNTIAGGQSPAISLSDAFRTTKRKEESAELPLSTAFKSVPSFAQQQEYAKNPPKSSAGEMLSLAISSYEDARRRMAESRSTVRQLGQDFGEWATQRVPFIGSGMQLLDAGKAMEAANNVKSGKFDHSDIDVLADFIVRSKESDDLYNSRTAAGKVWDIASRIPGFLVEFGASSGAAGAVKEVVKNGVRYTVTKTLPTGLRTAVAGRAVNLAARVPSAVVKSPITRGATKVAGEAVTGAVQTALTPSLAANIAERTLPRDVDEQGNLTFPTTGQAVAEGVADTFIETFTERLGGEAVGQVAGYFAKKPGQALAKILGPDRVAKLSQAISGFTPVDRALAIKSRVAQWAAQKYRRTVPQMMQRLADKGQFHGVLGEYLEERYGEGMRIAAGGLGLELVDADKTVVGQVASGDSEKLRGALEQTLIEGAAFAAMPALQLSLGAIEDATTRKDRYETLKDVRDQTSVYKGNRVPVSMAEREKELIPYSHEQGFAKIWAESNPSTAAALVKKAKENGGGLSINDFEQFGLSRQGANQQQRREFAGWVQSWVEQNPNAAAKPSTEQQPTNTETAADETPSAVPPAQSTATTQPQPESPSIQQPKIEPEAESPKTSPPQKKSTIEEEDALAVEWHRKRGFDAKIVDADESDGDAVEFLRNLGVEARFIDVGDDGGRAPVGVSRPGSNVAYIRKDVRRKKGDDTFWDAVVHEAFHATGADERVGKELSADEIDAGTQNYLKGALPSYAEDVKKDPAKAVREGAAHIAGRLARDKSFRDEMLGKNPSLVAKIVRMVLKAVGAYKPQSKTAQAVLTELRSIADRVATQKQQPPTTSTETAKPDVAKLTPEEVREQLKRKIAEKKAKEQGQQPAAEEPTKSTPVVEQKKPVGPPMKKPATKPETIPPRPSTTPTAGPTAKQASSSDRFKNLAEKFKKKTGQSGSPIGSSLILGSAAETSPADYDPFSDEELINDAADIVSAMLQEGVRDFRTFIKAARDAIGDDTVIRMGQLFELAWNGVRDVVGADVLDEAEDPAIFIEIDDELEQETSDGTGNNDRGGVDSQGVGEDATERGGSTPETGEAPRDGEPSGGGSGPTGGGALEGGDAGGSSAEDGGRATGDDSGPSRPGGKRGGGKGGKRKGKKGERPADETPVEQPTTGDNVSGSDADSGRKPGGRDAPLHYRLTDADAVESGGKVSKFDRNIAAIQTLRTIESEHRKATAEEQKILAKFTGWGQQYNYFVKLDKDLREAGIYDPKNLDHWIADPAEKFPTTTLDQARVVDLLKSLPPREYFAARRSAQFSHYTSPVVARGMWNWIERVIPPNRVGSIRVLEPSEGSGIFWGTMPDSILDKASMWGIDPDEVSQRIARQLYQGVNHDGRKFEQIPYPDNFFDVIVTNVPFSSSETADPLDEELHKAKASLHNYFFLKAAKKVRPGGIVAMVTSHWTMDSEGDKHRKQIASLGLQFLGAVRLPNTAFAQLAGTRVTTDILLFQKGDKSLVRGPQKWTRSIPRSVPTNKTEKKNGKDVRLESVALPYNEYFVDNRRQIIGTLTGNGTMRSGEPELTVEGPIDDLESKLAEAMSRIPFNSAAFEAGQGVPLEEFTEANNKIDLPPGLAEIEQGMSVVHKGRLWVRIGDNLELLKAAPLGEQDKKRAAAWFGLRDASRRLRKLQRDDSAADEQVEVARKKLNEVYDAYVEKWNFANASKNRSMFKGDWFINEVLALEEWDRQNKTAKKADIFTRRTEQPPAKSPESADSPKDALIISMHYRGGIDVPFIASLLKTTPGDAESQLEELTFKDPATNSLAIKEEYLSGNVRRKLNQAQDAVNQGNQEYQRNVDALKEVLPRDATPGEIIIIPGATWIRGEDYAEFAEDVLGVGDLRIKRIGVGSGGWTLDRTNATNDGNPTVDEEYRVRDRNGNGGRWDGIDLLQRILNDESLVYWVTDRDGNRYIHEEFSASAETKAADLKNKFQSWVWEDQSRADELVRIYNDTYRSHAKKNLPDWLVSKIGLDTAVFDPRDYQLSGAARAIAGNTGLFYVVGAGKTLTSVMAAMEARRLGVWRKPVVVAPNHLVDQWAGDVIKAYPGAKVLAATKDDFSPQGRQTLFNRISTGDWDIVVVPQSSFKKMPMSPGYQHSFFAEQLAQFEDAIVREHEANGKKSPTLKELERQKAAFEDRMAKMLNEADKDPGPYFDELGIDSIIVDECFPWETPILTDRGWLPIGKVVDDRLPVKVLSYNHETGEKEWKKVVRWIPVVSQKTLVKVHHEFGSFVCTEDHKIWTESGYVEASRLASNNFLFTVQSEVRETEASVHEDALRPVQVDEEEVRALRSSICGDRSMLASSSQSPVLQQEVLGNLEKSIKQGFDVRRSTRRQGNKAGAVSGDFGQDEGEQSNEKPGERRESSSLHEGKDVPVSWRKFEDHSGTNGSCQRDVAAGGVCYSNGTGSEEPIQELAELLQGRRSLTGSQTGNRNRRQNAQTSEVEVSRRQKDFSFELSRVDRVEVLESGSAERPASRAGKDSVVYDIEVEGNHNFYADGVLVSNCHDFKNLFFATRHGRVPGINSTGNQKTFDMLMKTDYLNGLNGGRGVVFATGTPIANSMAEAWVMMRYLQPDLLKEAGVFAFDDWKSVFGQVVEMARVDPIGQKFRVEQRFQRFVNLPELRRLMEATSDFKRDKDIGLEKPSIAGGISSTVTVKASPVVRDFMNGLASRSVNRPNDPSIDNMLVVMNDGVKMAVDMRLLDPTNEKMQVQPDSKLKQVSKKVVDIHKLTTPFKGTQIVWLDVGVPIKPKNLNDDMKEAGRRLLARLRENPSDVVSVDDLRAEYMAVAGGKKTASRDFLNWLRMIEEEVRWEEATEDDDGAVNIGGKPEDDDPDNPPHWVSGVEAADDTITSQQPPPWNAYLEIKKQLIAGGIPESEIEFVHNLDTDARRRDGYAKMRSGETRVMIASTRKMGTGANVQERLVASHDVDPPWRPADLEQRRGRILRFGNNALKFAKELGIALNLASIDAQPPKDREDSEGVYVFQYVTEASVDARKWQTLEDKQAILEQFYSGDESQREAEDVGGGMSESDQMAAVKASAASDPRMVEQTDLRTQVKRLTTQQRAFNADRHAARRAIGEIETNTAERKKRIEKLKILDAEFRAKREALPEDETIDLEVFDVLGSPTRYGKTTEAAKALDDRLMAIGKELTPVSLKAVGLEGGVSSWEKKYAASKSGVIKVGRVYGKNLYARVSGGWRHAEDNSRTMAGNSQNMVDREKMPDEEKAKWKKGFIDVEFGFATDGTNITGRKGELGSLSTGHVARLNNYFEGFAKEAAELERQNEHDAKRMPTMQKVAAAEWPHEQELDTKSKRLIELNKELGDNEEDRFSKYWVMSQELIDALGGDHSSVAGRMRRLTIDAGGWVGDIKDPNTGETLHVWTRKPAAEGQTTPRPARPGLVWVTNEDGDKADWATVTQGKVLGQRPEVPKKKKDGDGPDGTELDPNEYDDAGSPIRDMGHGFPVSVDDDLPPADTPTGRLPQAIAATSAAPYVVEDGYVELGAPGSTPRPKMPVGPVQFPAVQARAVKNKDVSKRDVVDALRKGLAAFADTFQKANAPIRYGRVRNKLYAGTYAIYPEVIRLRFAQDYWTGAHEVGHAIEKMVYGWPKGGPWDKKLVGRLALKELVKMGRDLYGNSRPSGGYKREGFAEFMRFWIAAPHIALQKAPNFYRWFEGTFLELSPKGKKALENAQQLALDYQNQNPGERGIANIVDPSSPDKSLKNIIKFFTEVASFQGIVEELQSLAKLQAEAKRISGRDLSLGERPYDINYALRSTASARLKFMRERGMLDYAGNLVPGVNPLNEVGKLVRSKDRWKFTAFLWALRAKRLWNHVVPDPKNPGKMVRYPRNPGMSEADADWIIDKWGTARFYEAQAIVEGFQNGILNYISQASPELARGVRIIRAIDPGFYIPLHREFEEFERVYTTSKAASSDMATISAKLRGSERRVIDPIQVLLSQAQDLLEKAHDRAVEDAVHGISRIIGSGELLERLEPDQIPTESRSVTELLGRIQKQIANRGVTIDLTDAQGQPVDPVSLVNEIVTLFGNAKHPKTGEPIRARMEKGRIVWYQYVPQVYKTLSGETGKTLLSVLQRHGADFWLLRAADKLGRGTAQSIRLGATGLNAPFAIVTNSIVDAATLSMNSKSRAKFIRSYLNILRMMPVALADAISVGHANTPAKVGAMTGAAAGATGGLVFGPVGAAVGAVGGAAWGALSARGGLAQKIVDLHQQLGGRMAQSIHAQSGYSRRAAESIFGTRFIDIRTFGDFFNYAKRVPGRAYDYLGDVLQYSDTAARAAEIKMVAEDYKIDLNAPLSVEDSLFLLTALKQGTTDFSATGSWTKNISPYIPFLRSNIQGPRSSLRAIVVNPAVWLLRLSSMMATTAILHMLVKDEPWYKELDPLEKLKNYHIPINWNGNDEVLVVPRERVIGMAAAAVTIVIDLLGKDDPEAAKELLQMFVREQNPFDPSKMKPPLFREYSQQKENRDEYFGTPIVGPSLANKPAVEQYDQNTTAIAKWLGEQTGTSPKRVEHAVTSLTGGVGRSAMKVGSRLIFGQQSATNREDEPSDIPIFGRLFRREGLIGSQPQSVKKLYELRERAAERAESESNPETPNERQDRLALEDAANALKSLDRLKRRTYSTAVRRLIDRDRLTVAQAAIEVVESDNPADRVSMAVMRKTYGYFELEGTDRIKYLKNLRESATEAVNWPTSKYGETKQQAAEKMDNYRQRLQAKQSAAKALVEIDKMRDRYTDSKPVPEQPAGKQ